jgi:hypothetical protein
MAGDCVSINWRSNVEHLSESDSPPRSVPLSSARDVPGTSAVLAVPCLPCFRPMPTPTCDNFLYEELQGHAYGAPDRPALAGLVQ